MRKILLLGDTGKLGLAIKKVFNENAGYSIVGKNSSNLNAFDFESLNQIIEKENPEIVINTIAFLGIDPCECEPDKAFKINSLLPKKLSDMSIEKNFTLVHFSSDAVFDNSKNDFYYENDIPYPLNLYGATKYNGDCFVKSISEKYYIFRIPILFGFSNKQNQFVEKTIDKIKGGSKYINAADDIISSPTYTMDVAYKLLSFLENNEKYGLYHIANRGKASLYDIIKGIVKNLSLKVNVEKVSFKDFPFKGVKNTYTPLGSIKTSLLRPWEEALNDYCKELKKTNML